jgi:hypothetical protein
MIAIYEKPEGWAGRGGMGWTGQGGVEDASSLRIYRETSRQTLQMFKSPSVVVVKATTFLLHRQLLLPAALPAPFSMDT